MNPIYRHKLTIGATTYDVHPVYKDDMALDYQHESGEQFFRANLSGKMDFVGADASLIIGAPFTTEYTLTIECSIDGGITWTTFHVSKFYQTDCTIDVDDLKVTVKPSVKDRYDKVLDGMEKEYNLIELLPVIEPINMVKRPVIQIYGQGDSIITNIYGGMSWEQDFDLNGENPADFNFSLVSNRIEMTFNNPPSGLDGTFTGVKDNDGNFVLYNSENVYYVRRYYVSITHEFFLVTDVIRVADNEPIWRNNGDSGLSMEFYEIGQRYNTITSSGYETNIWARFLCDVTSFVNEGVTKSTYPIRTDDPCYGGNYHYVVGYRVTELVQSTRTSTTPTQWGRKNETEYYEAPSDDLPFTDMYIPVSRSLWVNYSFWYQYSFNIDNPVEASLRKVFTLRDSYPLWSVIQVLLNKLGTGVTFAGTSEYSQFFYGGNNPLSYNFPVLPYISPKSNVIKGEYHDPAMKAPITLAVVLNMLKKAFGCYWYIDSNNKMHIEHISWFKNGGSYDQVPQVGIDLTMMEQPTNLKRWSFDRNNYQFDKEQMPARYQYKWMDDGTDVFDGNAVDIDSPFVQADKVEEISISNFTADVDYMLVAPENCSKDGFALLLPKKDYLGVNNITLEVRTINGKIRMIQNWFASLSNLIPEFLVSDLPSWNYKVNDEEKTARGIQRQKKQQVQIPLGSTTPDMMQLVRTGMGEGQIERMSINLSSRMAKTTLKYDTYDAE